MTADGANSRVVILVVEDEAPNRALLRAVLSRAGDPRLERATVREAANLAEARIVLAGERVDLVVLDVRLPDGNGLDLARELQAAGGPDKPRILVLSASVLAPDRETAAAAGIDHFMGKPYRPADVISQIVDLLDRSVADRVG